MRPVASAPVPSLGDMPLRSLIDEYVVALGVAGRSGRTIGWYRTYLAAFEGFASRDGRAATLDDVSPVTARRWLLATQSARTRPLAPNSLAGRVRTLRAFGGWLQRELQLEAHPLAGLPMPNVPDVLVPSLTESELRALMAAIDERSRDSVRDRATLLTLRDTGMRLGELVGCLSATST